MSLFSIEHGKTAYRADFALYGGVVTVMTLYVLFAAPRDRALGIVVATALGLVGWTFAEYVLHRFVLHALPPFARWHAEHHGRPSALICAPTVLSGTLVALLVFLPMLLWADLWLACAVTLGLLGGYLGYAITHHGTHHWRAGNAWSARRKPHRRCTLQRKVSGDLLNGRRHCRLLATLSDPGPPWAASRFRDTSRRT